MCVCVCVCVLHGNRILQKKRAGQMKSTEEICSKKTDKLGELYFCFKRKRDKEAYG